MTTGSLTGLQNQLDLPHVTTEPFTRLQQLTKEHPSRVFRTFTTRDDGAVSKTVARKRRAWTKETEPHICHPPRTAVESIPRPKVPKRILLIRTTRRRHQKATNCALAQSLRMNTREREREEWKNALSLHLASLRSSKHPVVAFPRFAVLSPRSQPSLVASACGSPNARP